MRRFMTTIVLGFFALGAHADAIWGSWYGVNQGQAQGTVVFSFFPDGEYFLNDHGIQALDPTGQPGIERGTYTWNAATGAFTFNTLVNTDGQWGLSNSGVNSVQIVGNTLTGTAADGTFVLNRVVDPTSAIVGGWYARNMPNPGDLGVLNFLPNGTYLLGRDPASTSFLEFGTYSWNAQTGAFQFHVTDTTDPNSGFNGSTIPTILVNGNTITIDSSDGVTTGTAVAAIPEPETWALMLAGIGIVGALARRSGRRIGATG
jgi:hypothetical protein